MSSIVQTSIKRPLLILVLFTILGLGGIVCYNMLNLNLLPKFEVPVMTVATVYPGAGASEVETSVTKKMEDALSTLENLKRITSTSQEGVSIVVVELNEGADINIAVQDAQRKINAIKADLPTEVKDPSIDKISLDEIAVMEVAVTSDLASTEFFKLVEDRIQPRLAKLPGAGAVTMIGGYEREIKVNIDKDKLKHYNLSILQVLQAIQTANMEIPAGNVEDPESVYSVRLAAKFNSLDEIRNTVIIQTPSGGKIKILDVAEVEDGVAEQKLINHMNGSEAIGLSIQKQSDANAVHLTDLVKEEMAAMEKEFRKEGVTFEIAIDTSVYTRASANAVVVDLMLAILIVAFICLIFLHNIRSALIIMIAVPMSIVPSFIVLYIMGYSLNMMSLMALSLVVSILVDDSIVVIENMVHMMEKGMSKRKAAYEGCKQIMYTVMAITLVIVVVFLPLAVTGGLIGNILKEFAVPIITATLCSLLVSFTLTPLLMSRFGKLSDDTSDKPNARFSRFIEKQMDDLKEWYGIVLQAALRHKTAILSATIILLIGAVSLIPGGFIGFAFMEETDQGEFNLTLDMNPDVTVYQNNLITMQAEEIIRSHPEVIRVYSKIGASGSMLNSSMAKNNVTTISVKLVDKDKRNMDVADFAEMIKGEVMQIPGVRARAQVSSTGGSMEPIQLTIQGTDFEQVETTAAMILDIARNVPGVTDAKLSTDDPRQEVQVNLDREKMSTLGLSVSTVGSTLRTALNGNDDSKYQDGNYEYNINVKIDDMDRTNMEDVARISFLNDRGELIELSQFAEIKYGLGPATLERMNRISSITVKTNVVGRPSGTVGNEIKAGFAGKIPEGITVEEGGMMEQQTDAFASLAFAFIAAIVLIYLIMVALYDSLLDPIVVLCSIPLSFIGAFLALALTKNDLTIFSIIGLITLIGLVCKNAILLIDFINHHLKDGMDIKEAIVRSGKERLRPILMTTFAMIFGMLPIALAAGDGAEMKNGMAWVIIGGLASSMLLTLVVVPIIYFVFHSITTRFRHYRKNRVVAKIKAEWLEDEPDAVEIR
ncbi:MAG: efflux RND transporter permease subunit [Candidatus Azobacteroides sp.]|nr:efflux RND transporter permease subunit [Candidatus Azobacteroides sp.]